MKRKLWPLFAHWIKVRDRFTCVTCGRKVEGRNAQAGHYIAKAACGLDYYFSEMNVNCQCSACNLFLEGNRPAYRKYLVNKYGEKEVLNLEKNYHKPSKDFPFEAKIFYYSQTTL